MRWENAPKLPDGWDPSKPYPPATYRTGRHLGRTIYRVTNGRDECIGMMDTPELGRLVVDALNRYACTCIDATRPAGPTPKLHQPGSS